MKKIKIKSLILYCILVIIWSLLIFPIFTSCTIYEREQVELIRCPQVQDSINIPDWEDPNESGHDTGK